MVKNWISRNSFRNILAALFIMQFLHPVEINAQSKTVIRYSIEEGLVSNLTKCVVQDPVGYIWLASDAGLIRFDGRQFKLFRDNLRSYFIKSVTVLDKHRLLVLADEDVGILETNGFYYSYKSILDLYEHGAIAKFNYPKSAYVDKAGTIWISDLNNIYSVEHNKITRFELAEAYSADSYVRSVTFWEDNIGNLMAFSYRGDLWSFDRAQKRFNKNTFIFQGGNTTIECMLPLDKETFLVGSEAGIYKLSTRNALKNIFCELYASVPNVSGLAFDSHGVLFIGTYTNGLHFIDNFRIAKPQIFQGLSFSSIKNLYSDHDGNIWVASDEGAALLDDNWFRQVDFSTLRKNLGNIFIYSLSKDTDGTIYCSDDNNIYKMTPQNNSIEAHIFSDWQHTSPYYCSVGKRGIWISYRDQRLELRDKKNKRLLFEYHTKNSRIGNLYVDESDNLWAYSERDKKIVKITVQNEVFLYSLPGHVRTITLIKELRGNEIYAAGMGERSFFFKFDKSKQSFVNLTSETGPEYLPPFIINDFFADKAGCFHLASNKGYFQFNSKSLTKYSLPHELENTPIKAVESDGSRIFLGTEKGLIILQEGQGVLFDRQEGLPNSTIVNKGLLFGNDSCLWVATASGIAVNRSSFGALNKTPAPVFTEIFVTDQTNPTDARFRAGNSFTFKFASLNYPANKTRYQYRLLGVDTNWVDLVYGAEVYFPKLPVGEYLLEIKATAIGMRESASTFYAFSILPPWYFSVYAIIAYAVIGFLLIIYFVNAFYMRRIHLMKEREELLNDLVQKRTADLQQAKEKAEVLLMEAEKAKKELEDSNNLKSQILSIAAHDLKNPLSIIMAYSSELTTLAKDEETQYLSGTLKEISLKMLSIINELLESVAARAKTAVLNKQVVDLTKPIQEVISINEKRANQKEQVIETEYIGNVSVYVDCDLVKHAVDNLVSNAVKYSPLGGRIRVVTRVVNNNYQILVKDEGPGFTEDDKKRMFGVFQRLSARPTGNEGSTGLGLSIVKDVVERNGGRVWVESEFNEGATFFIEFPIHHSE
ncbi:MAG: ATP-binding protein [Ignavibacteria bacterium]|nr:ATP-binding protein [Ignavibacteria bacterium]